MTLSRKIIITFARDGGGQDPVAEKVQENEEKAQEKEKATVTSVAAAGMTLLHVRYRIDPQHPDIFKIAKVP